MIRPPRGGRCAHTRWIHPPGGKISWRFPGWTGLLI
nr:MAG TPA: hypothetical protein [Caudoviricetes sp.]